MQWSLFYGSLNVYTFLLTLYEDSENIKMDRVNTVILNLHQTRQRDIVWTHSINRSKTTCYDQISGQRRL